MLSRSRLALVPLTAVLVGGSLFTGALPASAEPRTVVIFTGAPESVPVPDGYCSVRITAEGAAGGASTDGIAGGRGARVTVTVPITPGSELTGDVGGTGTYEFGELNGGYGGGGTGGAYIADGIRTLFAGGGGGRTIVTLDGTLIVVAGGGGGGGNSALGLTGGTGADAGSEAATGAAGAFGGGAGGGSGDTGGAGGAHDPATSISEAGQTGVGPAGGAGGDSYAVIAGAGGGGGAGLTGGGGGAASPIEGDTLENAPGGGGGGAGSSTGPEGAVISTSEFAEGDGNLSLTFIDCAPTDPATPTTSPTMTTGPAQTAAGQPRLADTGFSPLPAMFALAALVGGAALLMKRRVAS